MFNSLNTEYKSSNAADVKYKNIGKTLATYVADFMNYSAPSASVKTSTN